MKNTAIPAPPDPGPDARRRDRARTTMIDGITEIDPDTWDVPSGSRSGVTYRVRRNPRGFFTCDCVGFGFRYACRHTDSVRRVVKAAQSSFAHLDGRRFTFQHDGGSPAQFALCEAAEHQRERDLQRKHHWTLDQVRATYSQF